MKLAILALFAAVSVSAQTNLLVTNVNHTAKERKSCNGVTYWSNGEADFRPIVSGNWGYISDTNVITLTFTNTSARMSAISLTGQGPFCGTSSLTFTDASYPDQWRFAIYWNTNSPFPSNPVTLTAVGPTNK